MLRVWNRLPILYKVLIGNAAVIVVGALAGTYTTQRLLQASTLELALSFATAGLLLSLLLNYAILRNAFRPMSLLQATVERIDRGDTLVRAAAKDIGDPQLARFAHALNTMLERLASHTRTIESNRDQLSRLSGQVLTAQEEERKRIARGLHDDTNGALARVLLNLAMVDTLLPEGLSEAHEKISETRVLTEKTLEDIRKIIFDLRPTLLDDLGLGAAVHWYAKENLERAGIQVTVDAAGNLGRASPRVEIAFFRIAQEAISNIIRHSHAKHVTIRLSREGTRWVLFVHDDGSGFDTSNADEAGMGEGRWGLLGVQERVNLFGGTWKIESGPGQGTTLCVELPVE
jgi:two-component system, NarL family, sensor histidine kinase UhpB